MAYFFHSEKSLFVVNLPSTNKSPKSLQMRLFFLFLMTCFSLTARASVWTATNSWNESWESRYAEWVQVNITKDYFVSGPYGAVLTDCADSVYAARLIFSYENNLPFIGGGVSQNTSRFDHIQDRKARFVSFMNYVLEMTSTHTLSSDSYPVALDRRFFRAGIIFLQRRSDSGHVELVKDVRDNGVIEFAGSTLPKKVRELVISTSLTVMPVDSSSGFRAWIQPDQRGKSINTLPGYSLEQFQNTQPATSEQLKAWTEKVTAKLALTAEPVAESIRRRSQDLCTLAQARIAVVLDAYNYKNQVQRCLNQSEYDAYSTPGKDKRLLRTLEQTLTLLYPNQKRLTLEMIDNLSSELNSCAQLDYFPGRSISVLDFLKNLAKKRAASDPNETVDERWGVMTPNKNNCPQY